MGHKHTTTTSAGVLTGTTVAMGKCRVLLNNKNKAGCFIFIQDLPCVCARARLFVTDQSPITHPTSDHNILTSDLLTGKDTRTRAHAMLRVTITCRRSSSILLLLIIFRSCVISGKQNKQKVVVGKEKLNEKINAKGKRAVSRDPQPT